MGDHDRLGSVEAPVPDGRAGVVNQLNRILQSAAFSSAPSLRHLLHHLVMESIDGRSHQLKEYALGVDVFDRGPGFDPKVDTIVRVQARRLRAKLAEYYDGDGAGDELIIELPRGHYVPAWRHRLVQRHALMPVDGRQSGADAGRSGVLSRARGWMMPGAALLALAAVGVTAWRLATGPTPAADKARGRSGPSTSAARLAEVVPFENRSRDRSLDPLGEQIAGRIAGAIAALPGVEAVTGDVADASLSVQGAVFLHGDRLELQGRVVDGNTGEVLYALPPFEALRADPGPGLDRLERHVAGAVAVHLDEFFGGLQFVSQPPSIDGYREYRAGLEIFSWDYPRAIAHLDRALEFDPQFWLPRVVLFFAYYNTGQGAKGREQLSAIERDRGRRTPAELLFIDFLGETIPGGSGPGVRMLRDLAVLMPHSLLVNYNLVEQLLRTNRPRDAVDAYDRLSVDVHTLRHSIGAWRVRLVTRALHQLGQHERELAESRNGQRQTPGKLFFVQAEVRALAALGRLDELKRVADRSLTIPATTRSGTAGDVLHDAALELRAHGNPRASLVYAQRSIDWWRGQERGGQAERAALGRALYAAEHWSEAEREFAALSAQAPEDPEYIFYRGLSAAGHGDMARARHVARLLQLQAPQRDRPGYVTYLRAELAAALGERALAVDLLREALAHGVPYGLHIHQSRAFESLRADASFQQLVRQQE